mgnify:FL=1
MDGNTTILVANDNFLNLDEAIYRLKKLRKRVVINKFLGDTKTEMDFEVLIEILEIIDGLDVPLRLSEEGIA